MTPTMLSGPRGSVYWTVTDGVLAGRSKLLYQPGSQRHVVGRSAHHDGLAGVVSEYSLNVSDGANQRHHLLRLHRDSRIGQVKHVRDIVAGERVVVRCGRRHAYRLIELVDEPCGHRDLAAGATRRHGVQRVIDEQPLDVN